MADVRHRLYGVGLRNRKVILVAHYSNVYLDVNTNIPTGNGFVWGVTHKEPWFTALSPTGKFPLLEIVDAKSGASLGSLVESNAICKYVCSLAPAAFGKTSSPALYPTDDAAQMAQIDAWIDFSLIFDAVGKDWLYPMFGAAAYDQAHTAAAKATCQRTLEGLERHLASSGRAYLVTDHVTLADVVVLTQTVTFWRLVFTPEFLKPYPAYTRWMSTMLSQPKVRAVLGPCVQATQEAVYKPDAPLDMSLASYVSDYAAEWPSSRVRQTFIDFFNKKKQHTVVPSSSVVPHDDPTLLFTNAGMNQFKAIFLGKADPKGPLAKLRRACDTQKCIRAGGKHNDLDDVGKDTYHHTFFEMLGNWSFGDYFKREAITWAWELLTQVYGLPAERLYATYFGGDEKLGLAADDEAKNIWLELLPPDKVLPFGCKDNFWEMGDQGPCGPCTEIHYDRCGGRDAAALVNDDDPTCLEIWNLVFIQFNREPDGSLKPLPHKHVDTGMGFERIASILQGVMSNYDTDIFQPLFAAIQKATGAAPYTGKLDDEDADNKDMAYRVVADHIRTISFAIADGSQPGSDGREYVLRRVLRRAVRYGREVLGGKEGFFAGLVPALVECMGDVFPELRKHEKKIVEIIADEETSFGRTLQRGIDYFKKLAAKVGPNRQISGDDAFFLWDSYGFPVDLTELMAEEHKLTVDKGGFEEAMNAAKEKSRASRKTGAGGALKFEAAATSALQNMGVQPTDQESKYVQGACTATVKGIYVGSGEFVPSTKDVAAGQSYGLVLDRTSYYPEQGGQVADVGAIASSSSYKFTVADCQVAAGFVLHIGTSSSGSISVGDKVTCEVDYTLRNKTMPNHTMTHVLNFALRRTLGDGVDQKGSIVDPSKLRFDFSHNKPVSPDELAKVEAIVSKVIADGLPVHAKEASLDAAKAINGLRAVFGETYPDPVRVVAVGATVDQLLSDPSNAKWADMSIEFCGGTHLSNSKEAHAFALVTEEGIAKGIRRIVGLTGDLAKEAIAEGAAYTKRIDAIEKFEVGPKMEAELNPFKVDLDSAVISVTTKHKLRERISTLGKKIVDANKAMAGANKAKAVAAATQAVAAACAAGEKFVVVDLQVGSDSKAMNDAIGAAMKASPTLPTLLVSADAAKDKCCMNVGVPKDAQGAVDALAWLKAVLEPIGGKGGGGKNGLAQGQGVGAAKLADCIAAGKAFLSK